MQLITTMSILNKVPNLKSILETFRMYMLFLFDDVVFLYMLDFMVGLIM